MTHPYVWRIHSYTWHDSLCMWYMCDMTHSYVWHDSLIWLGKVTVKAVKALHRLRMQQLFEYIQFRVLSTAAAAWVFSKFKFFLSWGLNATHFRENDLQHKLCARLSFFLGFRRHNLITQAGLSGWRTPDSPLRTQDPVPANCPRHRFFLD